MKDLLLRAKSEIERNRRELEILRAKVDVMDLFATVFFTEPRKRQNACGIDICWEIAHKLADANIAPNTHPTKVDFAIAPAEGSQIALHPSPYRWSKDEIETVRQYKASGLSEKQIAFNMGFSVNQIHGAVLKIQKRKYKKLKPGKAKGALSGTVRHAKAARNPNVFAQKESVEAQAYGVDNVCMS